MRRNYLIKSILVAMLAVAPVITSFAIRAYPGLIKIKQPDGSTLTIRNHGDEFRHYTTTEDNFVVKQNASGFYTYATVDAQGVITEGASSKEEPTDLAQKEFYRISKIVFQDVEKKYRIHLDNYELSILYELLNKVIKEPVGLDEA